MKSSNSSSSIEKNATPLCLQNFLLSILFGLRGSSSYGFSREQDQATAQR